MTEHNENEATPAEHDEAPSPPTVDDVRRQQQRDFPEQADTATHHRPATGAELAAVDAGGEVVDDPDELLIEGPNPA